MNSNSKRVYLIRQHTVIFWCFVVLQMFTLQPSVKPESHEGESIMALVKDPYILIAAGKKLD